MDVRAQFAMVMNLEKCIGCHTCSVTCKNMWTNRKGTEYMWWNNVETKPGTGFPGSWEDQEKYKGGWEKSSGGLKLKLGGKTKLFTRIFYNPDQPSMKNYYEPWTYNYSHLISAPDSKTQPTARAVSQITGEYMEIENGPNWDDDLSGSYKYASNDPNMDDREKKLLKELESVFMFYLPRICNHCVNPACVAACPSGAIYKRGEDGIVLVDQEKCKSWRYCVSACPYKKVYFNWNTVKSEKCIFCYPRTENGESTICSKSCVGKIRNLGVILYDADAFAKAMDSEDNDLTEAFKRSILDPNDEENIKAAESPGINAEWLKAASNSPVYTYIKELEIALPLHPEFRTFPSVFYVPPLSPVTAAAEIHDEIPSAADLRIPVRYLSKLFSAGSESVIEGVLKRLLVIRKYMRAKGLDEKAKLDEIIGDSPLTKEQIEKAHKLFTQAKADERFVLPQTFRAEAEDPYENQGVTGFGIKGKKGLRK